MSRSNYTPEQRAEALELFTSVGAAQASKRTGIPAGTIASWATRGGIAGEASAQLRTAVEVRTLTIAERKATFAETLLGHAVRIAAQLEQPTVEKHVKVVGLGQGVGTTEIVEVHYDRPPTADQKRIAETVAVLVDKIQLLTGEATSRTETTQLDAGGVQERALATVRQLRGESAA